MKRCLTEAPNDEKVGEKREESQGKSARGRQKETFEVGGCMVQTGLCTIAKKRMLSAAQRGG